MKRRDLVRHLEPINANFYVRVVGTPGGTTLRKIADLPYHGIKKSTSFWPVRYAAI